MTRIDPEKFGTEVAAMVKAYVADRLAPLEARIAKLEGQQSKGSKPRVRVSAGEWQRPAEADQ